MERIVAVLLVLAINIAFAFDYNKLKGGNVDQQGIRNFGDSQRQRFLDNPANIKNRIGDKVKYDESKLNSDISNLTDKEAKQKLIDLMTKINSSSAKRTYRCYEERVVNVKTLFKCSLTNDIFNDKTTCNNNCVKIHNCIQSNCIQTARCEALLGGYVCPIQKVQCSSSISCPAGGAYNANTGKCEANPS